MLKTVKPFFDEPKTVNFYENHRGFTTFRNGACEAYSGLKKFFKNLKKIDFSIWVYLDVSENLGSFELYLFFAKNIV